MAPIPPEVEATFSEETKAFLAALRSIPEVPEEDDPNGWFHQIYDHLRRSPRERMERWAWFCRGALRRSSVRYGAPHVRFDPVRVLLTLSGHEVVFAMVGMGASYLRGAPYPSYDVDITPRMDTGNLARLERGLALLEAKPLETDEWGPVMEHTLPGFRRLMTVAGMVNIVDALPGVGGYDRIMAHADLLEVADGLVAPVASLEDVICKRGRSGWCSENSTRRTRRTGVRLPAPSPRPRGHFSQMSGHSFAGRRVYCGGLVGSHPMPGVCRSGDVVRRWRSGPADVRGGGDLPEHRAKMNRLPPWPVFRSWATEMGYLDQEGYIEHRLLLWDSQERSFAFRTGRTRARCRMNWRRWLLACSTPKRRWSPWMTLPATGWGTGHRNRQFRYSAAPGGCSRCDAEAPGGSPPRGHPSERRGSWN